MSKHFYVVEVKTSLTTKPGHYEFSSLTQALKLAGAVAKDGYQATIFSSKSSI